METLIYIAERLAIAVAAAQAGVVLALSIIIVVHYARHRSMTHVALVSASYFLLTALVSGAVIFQIFYSGWGRAAAIFTALIAFTLGDLALWKVWHNRNEVTEQLQLNKFEDQINRNTRRIDDLEMELHKALADTAPMHVIIDSPAPMPVTVVEGEAKNPIPMQVEIVESPVAVTVVEKDKSV